MLVPMLALLGVEVMLRVSGWGHPTSFFLGSTVNGREMLADNPQFGWRFFPPAIARTPEPNFFPARKAPGTCRVFVFGESAAMGDPEPAIGLPRLLQAILERKFPGKQFEVINVAMTAINSHVVREIARECARLEGDAWVIYMGNNEVVGPFGGGTVFGAQAPSLGVIRLALWIKTTRLGQWLGSLRPSTATEWGGMEMFLQQQVRHDDPRLAKVHAHFAGNLRDIVRLGAESGAQVVLSTVAVNLRDSPPFASRHGRPLSGSEAAEWDALFQSGVELERSGKFAAAKAGFEKARALGGDDTHAELRFHLARCHAGLGRVADAARDFNAAKELDTLRFRADDAINAAIRACTNAPGVAFVDAEALLAARCSNGIAGVELFHEHVHFNFDGNYELARAVFNQLAPRLPAHILGAARDGTPTRDDCAHRLAWNAWKQRGVLEEVRKRLQQPPFSSQSGSVLRDEALARRIDALSAGLTPQHLREIAAVYRAAIQRAPNDWVLREDCATLLGELEDHTGAVEQWREVARLLPHDAQPYFHLGNLADASGRTEEAITQFRGALRRQPGLVEARNGLALALANAGRASEARHELERAVQERPKFAEARVNLGQVLASQGDLAGARREYELALRANSNSAAAHVNLGKLLSVAGDKANAAMHYRAALGISPRNAVAHFNLGNSLLASAPDEAAEHYRAAVLLQPDFAEARYSLGLELARMGKPDEALAQFAEVARLKPEMAEGRFNHGVALAKARRFTEAAREFHETLRLQPGHAKAREFLEKANALK